MVDKLQQYIDNEYRDLSIEERKEIYDLYFNPETVQEMKDKLERIIFYKKPPTPEEFLDPSNGWLSENVTASIFPYIKEDLIHILDDKDIKNLIVEYGSTRRGKTFKARLIILYIIIFIHHIREPAMYYGLSPLTRLCIYMVSFKYDKTRQLYLEPMYEIMRQSSRFKQVKFQDQVRKQQIELGRDIIVWSKAAETGEITLASGLQIQLGNKDPNAIIGSDILACMISEISFFVQEAGATEEKIFELYTNSVSRIRNTVKQQYLAFVYLDTSANDSESMIENHIIKELQFKPRTYFSWMSLWEARPELFPEWQKTGKTFKVINGNGNIPTQIIEHEYQLTNVPKHLIIDVPIDAYDQFKTNLVKEIKDIAGQPTVKENKFISDLNVIDLMFDNPLIENIEGLLIADAGDKPEELLWNQIKGKFFSLSLEGKYKIKRAPHEIRYIGWDNATSLKGDVMGVSVVHKEWSRNLNTMIYVSDFSFAVGPKDKGISLDAPPCLVLDMIKYASLYVYGIGSDTFESFGQKQFLDRNSIKLVTQTTDKDVSIYQYLYTCLNTGTIKAGRNIFLKNNLNSLVVTKTDKGKEKVDHVNGTLYNLYNGDYDHSKCGINAKDVSDALAQAVFLAYSHDNYIPATCYEDENRRLSTSKEDIQFNVKEAYKKIHKFF